MQYLHMQGQTVDIVKDSKTVEDERQKIAVMQTKTDAATMNPFLIQYLPFMQMRILLIMTAL